MEIFYQFVDCYINKQQALKNRMLFGRENTFQIR